MLSIHPIKSAGQAGHYYAQADYYAKGDEADIASRWFGAGAAALGLAGGVDAEAFKAVLDGRLPDGTQLGRMGRDGLEHRAGWDFTLSAPKSVSILALAFISMASIWGVPMVRCWTSTNASQVFLMCNGRFPR